MGLLVILFELYSMLRPVMAILDIEVLCVDEKRREEVYQEVISQQGPPDGSIVVSIDGKDDFDDDLVDAILEKFGEIGEIILVR